MSFFKPFEPTPFNTFDLRKGIALQFPEYIEAYYKASSNADFYGGTGLTNFRPESLHAHILALHDYRFLPDHASIMLSLYGLEPDSCSEDGYYPRCDDCSVHLMGTYTSGKYVNSTDIDLSPFWRLLELYGSL